MRFSEERAHRAGVGVVAAARAAHGEQAALLALVERGVGARPAVRRRPMAPRPQGGKHALI